MSRRLLMRLEHPVERDLREPGVLVIGVGQLPVCLLLGKLRIPRLDLVV